MIQTDARQGFLAGMERFQHFLLFGLMISVTVLVFIQVLLRYVFRAPLMGIEEILLFPTVWLYFVGGINASCEESQIVARVLEIVLKKKRSVYFLRTLAAVVSLVVLVWLCYWSYDFLRYSLRMSKESATLYIPLIYAEASVFAGFTLMGAYTVVEAFRNFHIFKTAPADELVNGGELP